MVWYRIFSIALNILHQRNKLFRGKFIHFNRTNQYQVDLSSLTVTNFQLTAESFGNEFMVIAQGQLKKLLLVRWSDQYSSTFTNSLSPRSFSTAPTQRHRAKWWQWQIILEIHTLNFGKKRLVFWVQEHHASGIFNAVQL